MTSRSERRVPAEVFVPAYLAAVDSGMTREELAEKLGMRPSSIYQRIYDMHTQGACVKTFPQLPTKGRRSILDRISAAVEEYRKGVGAGVRQSGKGRAVAKGKPSDSGDGDLDATAEVERLLNR